MPTLKIKDGSGKWQDIASANTHKHTISDITDLPAGLAADVENLKNKVGAFSVAEQVDLAVKANTYTHPETHPAGMIDGLSAVATSGSFNDLTDVPDNLGGANITLTEKVIFEEQTMSFSYLSGFNAHAVAIQFDEDTPKFNLKVGDECTVVWEGEEYQVTVKDSNEVSEGTLYMGNGAPMDLPGEGEPFAIEFDSVGVTFFSLEELGQDETGSYTVKIYQTPKVQILPEISESDNGKVLGVVGGVWTKMDILADVAAMLASAGIIEPAAVEDNSILMDKENDIYVY